MEPEAVALRGEGVEECVHAGLAAGEAHGRRVLAPQLLLQVGDEAAHGAVVGAEHHAAVGLAQQLDVLEAEEERSCTKYVFTWAKSGQAPSFCLHHINSVLVIV